MKLKLAITSFVFACMTSLYSFGYYLLATDAGTQKLATWLNNYLAKTVHFDSVTGHILGTLEIRNLKFKSPQGKIRVQHIVSESRLQIFPLKLINKKLILENVRVSPRYFGSKTARKDRKSFFPIPVTADNIQIHNLRIKLDKKQVLTVPFLLVKLGVAPKALDLAIYRESPDKVFSLQMVRKKLELSLNLPVAKTKWQINYSKVKNEFSIGGLVSDQANGKIKLSGSGKTDSGISLAAENFHLNHLFKNYWPGTISFELDVKQQQQALAVLIKNISGKINNQKLTGDGQLLFNENKIQKVVCQLKSDDAKLLLFGERAQNLTVNWLIDIPQLKQFHPNSYGQLKAKGRLIADGSNPVLVGDFYARQLHLMDYQVGQGHGSFAIQNKLKAADSNFAIDLSNFTYKRVNFAHVACSGTGNLSMHNLKIAGSTKGQQFTSQLNGSLQSGTWHSTLTQFVLRDKAQTWQLVKPTDILINQDKFLLPSLVLKANHSMLNLQGDYAFSGNFHAKVVADNFNLNLINIFVPDDYRFEGLVSLKASASKMNSAHQLVLNGEIKPGSITFPYDNKAHKLHFNNGSFSSQLIGTRLASNFNLLFPNGKITSQVNLPKFSFDEGISQQAISGQLTTQWNDMSFLTQLIPVIRNVNGKLTGAFDFAGTITNPSLKGSLELSQGNFQIPKLNIKPNNVSIRARAEGKQLSYEGQLQSGRGQLRFNGSSKIENGGFPINLKLQGSNLLICSKPDLKILASPTMTLNLKGNDLQLNGTILLPEADLHPHDFGGFGSATTDVIFVDHEGKKMADTNLRISSKVALNLGDKIYLKYKGIKGQVLGQIRIEDDPNKATIAYGELRLKDGSYSMYSRTLQIDDGKLSFSGGPITNPALNIRASRTVQTNSNSLFKSQEQLKVGVNVLGTLQSPKITLFSQPPGQSQGDILSYLLLGVPANSVSGGNTELLLQAASAINSNSPYSVLNIKNSIKKSLGLSELDIGTTSEVNPKTQETLQHTAFILGKYLSPKFYVNYSLDLFDHTNTLKIRYLLNKYWTIQSVANTNNSGVDVLYTVER